MSWFQWFVLLFLAGFNLELGWIRKALEKIEEKTPKPRMREWDPTSETYESYREFPYK